MELLLLPTTKLYLKITLVLLIARQRTSPVRGTEWWSKIKNTEEYTIIITAITLFSLYYLNVVA